MALPRFHLPPTAWQPDALALEGPMDEQVPTLAAMLAGIPDPRGARGRRSPWSALLLEIVAGLLSGAQSHGAVGA